MPTALTRVVRFRAHHRLYRLDWSEERNRAAFGALADDGGHPHDYTCAVTVSGPLDERMGMVVDLVALDRILREEVVEAFDGKYLNRDVPLFAEGQTLPTCEALAVHVYDRVAPRLPPGVRLERVRIMEDPTLYADHTGAG